MSVVSSGHYWHHLEDEVPALPLDASHLFTVVTSANVGDSHQFLDLTSEV